MMGVNWKIETPINGQLKAKVFLTAVFKPYQSNLKNFRLTNGYWE